MVRPRRMPPTEAARRRRRCGEALRAARLQLAVGRDALARGSPAGSPVRAERLWLPHSPDRPNTVDTHQPVRRSSYLAVQQALARHTAQAALMLAARSCPGRGAGAAVPGQPARPGRRGERCAGRRGRARHRRAASLPRESFSCGNTVNGAKNTDSRSAQQTTRRRKPTRRSGARSCHAPGGVAARGPPF